MALVDLIATGKEAEDLIQKLADQKNQLATAALQHGNDQQQITDLQIRVGDLTDQVAEDVKERKATEVLIAQLTSLKVYDRLEAQKPTTNLDKVVGGSGLGTGGWKAPSAECAELWILDNPGTPAPNYVDAYDVWRVPADGTVTKFKLEASFLFPTAADVAACQCLEFEARQVTDDKKLVIIAGQLQYSGGQLRYFDWQQRAWLPFGVPIQKPAPLTWVTVSVEGHRGSTAVYYDAMTLNGTRTAMTQSYPLLDTTWSPLLWCALQLDDSSRVDGFRVKIDGVKFTVSN